LWYRRSSVIDRWVQIGSSRKRGTKAIIVGVVV
jgi:hypothetical protein